MNTMTKTLLTMTAAVALLSVFQASAADEQLPYEEIRAACQKFLAAYASPKDQKAMENRLKSQVQTKVSDQGIDEDRAMREIMLDWAAGAAKKLESKDRAAITQACFYFEKFITKGYLIPGQIRERLTVEKARKLIEYLESESAKVKELASK
ncbi:MAG: hypothetical protein HY291_02440 [Planctomycetes bacterium]|nr:hypothetical protein [Planctomycetota bacterium]